MKHLRSLAALAAVLALACLSVASTASATMLEVGGAAKNESVAIKASLKSGTSTHMTDTSGALLQICSASTIEAATTVFTGATVSAPISSLTFSSCSEGPVVVDSTGSISIENIAGTTNGTVRLNSAKWTQPSPFGPLTCTTPEGGTDIGTLTGVASGTATLDLQAVLNCGAITTKLTATYTVTSPEGLGVLGGTTTLEVGGVAKNESVAVKASVKAGTSSLLADTFGFFANTCTTSTVEGKTEGSFTGSSVGGKVSALAFSSCKEGNPTVDAAGSLSVERIGTTTNGTVKSKNAKVTVPSALGSLTCTTPEGGTDLGTLTGVASGTATIDISAVLACGISAKWTGTYTVTSPEGLGVTS